jgi:hypothetical protein
MDVGRDASPPAHEQHVQLEQREQHEQRAAAVQKMGAAELFALARQVFDAPSLDEDKLRVVLTPMAHLTCEELGLTKGPAAMLAAKKKIGYIDVYDDKKMSIGIFLLRKGACIPIHNHPEMVVLSKALIGKLRIVSYDLVADQSRRAQPADAAAAAATDADAAADADAAVAKPAAAPAAAAAAAGTKQKARHQARLVSDEIVTPDSPPTIVHPTLYVEKRKKKRKRRN